MAMTPSTMLPLGSIAPDFKLPDAVSSNIYSLQELASPIATVIMFICNHCPFVIHVQYKLAEIARVYQEKGIQFIAINANDIDKYPADAPALMAKAATTIGYTFPYLFDATQEVAKAYQAACTPDFYIFDGQLQCVYRGQFDSSRPGNTIPVTGSDLSAALDCLLTNKPVSTAQQPSIGCNIKWKE